MIQIMKNENPLSRTHIALVRTHSPTEHCSAINFSSTEKRRGTNMHTHKSKRKFNQHGWNLSSRSSGKYFWNEFSSYVDVSEWVCWFMTECESSIFAVIRCGILHFSTNDDCRALFASSNLYAAQLSFLLLFYPKTNQKQKYNIVVVVEETQGKQEKMSSAKRIFIAFFCNSYYSCDDDDDDDGLCVWLCVRARYRPIYVHLSASLTELKERHVHAQNIFGSFRSKLGTVKCIGRWP